MGCLGNGGSRAGEAVLYWASAWNYPRPISLVHHPQGLVYIRANGAPFFAAVVQHLVHWGKWGEENWAYVLLRAYRMQWMSRAE